MIRTIVPGIAETLLIAALDFGPKLDDQRVAEAIGSGLLDAGMPTPDILALGGDDGYGTAARYQAETRRGTGAGRGGLDATQLEALDFDARMKAARALVIATPRLDEQTLLGSLTFELATRARQSGVPAYAITAEDAIERFDARILDLQVVFEARTTRTLAGAGRKLAELT
ncbi:MAG TPA: glycerate kinase [Solirubrobacteraceae bacterium]|jgi:glycerate kinase